MENKNPKLHNLIQDKILTVCHDLNIEAKKEYKGKGWRADVFVFNENDPIAFEIQITPQSLNKTLLRQEKYSLAGVRGCWLFEKPIQKRYQERPDLPLFYVENQNEQLFVNLGDRRKISILEFLTHFINDKIQFRNKAICKKNQIVELVFYDYDCWKCKKKNHLYYVNNPFLSACNAKIHAKEALWASNSMEYRHEIIQEAKKILSQQNLHLGDIKQRYSKTVGDSYMSFGCYNCDSIFGDFYILDAKLGIMYDDKKIIHKVGVEINEKIIFNDLPHWCYPENGQFCKDL